MRIRKMVCSTYHCLTDQELRDVIDFSKGLGPGNVVHDYFYMRYIIGTAKNEQEALDLSSYNARRNSIMITKKRDLDGSISNVLSKNVRVVPLTDKSKVWIRSLIKSHKKRGQTLFFPHDVQFDRYLSYCWRLACSSLGISNGRMHSFKMNFKKMHP